MKSVAFYTLGCKVNQYETDAMIDLFKKNGYEILDSDKKSDIYIINTCTVTNLSERKSRQFIRKSKRINKDSIIGVVGCYAQTSPDEILEIKEVDFIIGTKDRNNIVEICEKVLSENRRINAVEDIMDTYEFEEMSIEETHGKTRAFLKIQEGCNQYCSYCIIPYARGNIRSRKIENIYSEVISLAQNGFKEIVLTGIHIASYGKDLGETRLIDVLEKIHDIDGIERIRLGSIEPNLVTFDFIERIKRLHKVCDHFHLSLQSGSDTVLKRMNRKYTTKEFKQIVELIRNYMPDAGITTDIIVGFPGETHDEFKETYEFVKAINFSKVHVFKYSPRKGTPAAEFKNQVDGNIKNERSKTLIQLTDNLTKEFHEKFLDKSIEVLIEDDLDIESNMCHGYSSNYIRALVKSNTTLNGQIIKVKPLSIQGENFICEVI